VREDWEAEKRVAGRREGRIGMRRRREGERVKGQGGRVGKRERKGKNCEGGVKRSLRQILTRVLQSSETSLVPSSVRVTQKKRGTQDWHRYGKRTERHAYRGQGQERIAVRS